MLYGYLSGNNSDLVRVLFSLCLWLHVACLLCAQGVTRRTFHDPEKKKIKEVYLVKDTVRNVLHGRYMSYYLNGVIESKGEFTNNETTGVWEFYYETGKPKMRGILFKGANYGMWEYFYETGKKSMEGIIYGKNREGEWKMYYENGQIKEQGEYKENKRTGIWKQYFEDGHIKGEGEFKDDVATLYKEYDHTGKLKGEGSRTGNRNTGHWRYFAADGSLDSEADFVLGKREGGWVRYFPSGKVYAKGQYINDEPAGKWEYFFETGNLSSAGEYKNGRKIGNWKTYSASGQLKSDHTLTQGAGEYKEYYPSGKLKLKGVMIEDGRRQGKWEYYYEDGTKEGECDYVNDKGTYYGYYPTGKLQTKGTLEGERKTGTWEIYESDGTLSGYYKPFYNQKTGKEITEIVSRTNTRNSRTQTRGFIYFKERGNEFRGVIAATNPIWLAVGRIPLGLEFYIEERLGHEFEFIGIRDPFFVADNNVAPGKRFERGYQISIKQKFYNGLRAGMWYFGHEFRFTNLGHFVNEPFNMQNPDNIFTFTANEQRIEWGPVLGYRIMKKNNAAGFTIDTFLSFNIGYRYFEEDVRFASHFEDINKDPLSTSVHFGINLGNVFAFQ